MPDYQVNFTAQCRGKLERLSPPEALREALATVRHDLGNDPYAFRPATLVDEQDRRVAIRFVRTGLYVSEIGVVPPLTLFFGINESRKQVLVLDILQGSGFGLDPNDP